ncbi:MAG: FmdB family zinc ribbon protein [Chloroflexota bacterium]
MPLYIYTCEACDIDIEELRSTEMADWPPVECPVCHDLCSRAPSTFHVQRQSSAAKTTNSTNTRPITHGANCVCCPPLRRRT